MDTALPHNSPFILDTNLAKATGTENHVCTSCDIVVLGYTVNFLVQHNESLSLVGNVGVRVGKVFERRLVHRAENGVVNRGESRVTASEERVEKLHVQNVSLKKNF